MQPLDQFIHQRAQSLVAGDDADATFAASFSVKFVLITTELMVDIKRFSDGRVIAVFEPRSATSRRKIFQKDFAQALATADAAIVSIPYDQSKIAEGDRFNSDELAADILKAKPSLPVRLGGDVDTIMKAIKELAKPKDVVLLMSNGGFGGIYEKLPQILKG